MKANLSIGLKLLVLTSLLFALYAVDFLHFSVTPEALAAPVPLALTTLLHTLVLSYAMSRTTQRGWRLGVALFLAFYGITTLMVAIEAVYLPDALPPDIVKSLLVNGGIAAGLFSCALVLVWGRWQPAPTSSASGQTPSISWLAWIGKFLLIGFVWTVLFVVFGALVFMSLARALAPEALSTYANMDMPAWVLPFQLVRGIIWAVLALPLIRILRGSRSRVALTVALLFAVLMGTNLLRATGLPAGLQIAHLVEVTGENFIFGWLVAWIVVGQRKTASKDQRL